VGRAARLGHGVRHRQRYAGGTAFVRTNARAIRTGITRGVLAPFDVRQLPLSFVVLAYVRLPFRDFRPLTTLDRGWNTTEHGDKTANRFSCFITVFCRVLTIASPYNNFFS